MRSLISVSLCMALFGCPTPPDGGTTAANWENSTPLGTQYAVTSTPGFLTFGYNGQFGSVEDLKSQNHDGSAILMGELTDPVANGMYFNHVNDFKNSGLGITGNN